MPATALNKRPHTTGVRVPATIKASDRAAQLAYEVAFGYFNPAQLQSLFDLAPAAYNALTSEPAFKTAVLAYRREIDEAGNPDFRIKARALSMRHLDTLSKIASDMSAEVKDRITAVQEINRLAGYGGKDDAAQQTGPAFALQINVAPTHTPTGTSTHAVTIGQ